MSLSIADFRFSIFDFGCRKCRFRCSNRQSAIKNRKCLTVAASRDRRPPGALPLPVLSNVLPTQHAASSGRLVDLLTLRVRGCGLLDPAGSTRSAAHMGPADDSTGGSPDGCSDTDSRRLGSSGMDHSQSGNRTGLSCQRRRKSWSAESRPNVPARNRHFRRRKSKIENRQSRQ